jgi:cytochrome c oxidase subunit IV
MGIHWGGGSVSSDATPTQGLGRDLVVYVSILVIAVLQVFLAYRSAPGEHLMVRMLTLALVQGGIAVAFFMHLREEKRGLVIALIPTTIFVLVMMNMIWTDSFRLFRMHP